MWNRQARNRDARLERAAHLTSAKLVPASEARALLEAVLEHFPIMLHSRSF
jgi:malonate decarboxylase alpha subunit